MIEFPDNFPVKVQPTFSILDASKLNQYLECPRSYFYRYILGWKREGTNKHLHFGTSIHDGLEQLVLARKPGTRGYTDESFYKAIKAFTDTYTAEYELGSAYDEDGSNKTYAKGIEALEKYVQNYADDEFIVHTIINDEGKAVPLTEISGTVPVSKQDIMHFRMDCVINLKQDGTTLLSSLEHKTCSNFGRQWLEQWNLGIQPLLYYHALVYWFGFKNVYNFYINGIQLLKGEPRFMRVELRKTLGNMDTFLGMLTRHLSHLKEDFSILADSKPSDSTFLAFAQNPQGCNKYFGCPYMDFCQSWSNPLRYRKEPPMGYIEEHWNPGARESKVNIELGF